MKILQVTTVATTLNSFLLPFTVSFKGEGWKVDAAASDIFEYENVVAAHDNCFNIDFCRSPFHFFRICRSLIDIRRLLTSQRYDVVHVHTPIAAFLTRLASLGIKNTKVFYTAHGFHYIKTNPKWKNAFFYFMEKIAGFNTDHLFVINQDDYKFAFEKNIVSSELVSFIHGIGVDTEVYKPVPEARITLINELKISEHSIIMLHIAELNNNKNHKVILKALSMLKKMDRCNDIHYVIVGKGKKRADLEMQIELLGLEGCVSFLGRRNDIPLLLSACDFVILPSLREGLPRSILEAMCINKPIIASDIRGCNDLLSTGAGVLVDRHDPVQWADAIELLYRSPEERELMGRIGRQLVDGPYKQQNVVDVVLDVYRKKEVKYD
ncbi:glycosyltransferase family 4 protein [Vibrio crassostreae]|uniref:glycosyltransferase family 4 protein n=1 Tax=Vibrio crassostreae TaxID=246167 RepID=UPI001B308087|nr:glycosyltransferase family 4 protein [Vibrio crassostreae]